MAPHFDRKTWLMAALGLMVALLGEGVVIYWSLNWYWAVGIFVPAILCIGYAQEKQLKARVEARFRDRPALTEKEFGHKYFPPDRAEIAARLRKILLRYVDVDLSRMQPEDRFIDDLRMDDLATVDYVIEVEREFGIKVDDAAAEKMTTFQHVVDYVSDSLYRRSSIRN